MTTSARSYEPGGIRRNYMQTEERPIIATDGSVISVFESVVRNQQDCIALSCISEGDTGFVGQISYERLNQVANRIARCLVLHGVTWESVVGIAVDHDYRTVAAILGTMKAGACFLPLDGSLPDTRITHVIRESRASAVVVPDKDGGRYGSMEVSVISVDGSEIENPEYEFNVGIPILPQNSAYVIYTSGSTGEPKGAIITQEALVNHGKGFSEIIELSPQDCVLQFANMAFDAAYEEIFPCLCQGGNLVLRNSEMARDIAALLRHCEEQQVTVLDLPTAFWHLLTTVLCAERWPLPASLRCIVIGGEKASPVHLRYWKENYTGTLRLLNTYGPTEATKIGRAHV